METKSSFINESRVKFAAGCLKRAPVNVLARIDCFAEEDRYLLFSTFLLHRCPSFIRPLNP